MRKTLLILLIVFFLFFISPFKANASSTYVLPYPSSMPGSVFYKVNLVKEKIMKYWYFGDFGQFEYNLKQSDKYLVESKTLIEYKQYLLAYQALQKSDNFFKNAWPNLEDARKKNKDVEQKQIIFKEASLKHMEVLNHIKSLVPEEFTWRPENAEPTELNLEKVIEEAIKIRKKF